MINETCKKLKNEYKEMEKLQNKISESEDILLKEYLEYLKETQNHLQYKRIKEMIKETGEKQLVINEIITDFLGGEDI